jgi:hypothetical protein
MIIKDENNARLGDYFDATTIPITHDCTIDEYTHDNRKIENANTHYKLHNDFIKHLWALRSNKYNESANFAIYMPLPIIKHCSIVQHF